MLGEQGKLTEHTVNTKAYIIATTLLLLGCGTEPTPLADASTDTTQTDDTTQAEVIDVEEVVHSDSDDTVASKDTLQADTTPQDTAETDGKDATPPDVPVTPVAVVNNEAWVSTPIDTDPFYKDGDPKPDICPDSETKTEETPKGLVFEVNTTFCAYLTVHQATVTSIPQGAELQLTLSHDTIIDGDGEYTLAVSIGSPAAIIWEANVPVGALEEDLKSTITAPDAFPEGTPIYFHISNHGENQWSFEQLVVLK
jgi:hypothetical protein